MLKRLQGHVQEKNTLPQAGNRPLPDTMYSESQLEQNLNRIHLETSDYQSKPHDALSPPCDALSPPSPPHWLDHRESEVLDLSSTYFPTSHDFNYYYQDPTAGSPSSPEQISPPSSPEPEEHDQLSAHQPRRFRSMRDVSPMDEQGRKAEDPSQVSPTPLYPRAPTGLRKGEVQSTSKPKFWRDKVAPNTKVRWDAYSGEPTSNGAGKASLVDPTSRGRRVGMTETSIMDDRNPKTGHDKRDLPRAQRVSRSGNHSSSGPVEPWSRTTGRSPIASPLRDQPCPKPLQRLRKPVSTLTEESGPASSLPFAADAAAVSHPTVHGETHEDAIKPPVPLKVGRNSPPRSGRISPSLPACKSPKPSAFSSPSPQSPSQNFVFPVTPTREEAQSLTAADSRSAKQTAEKGIIEASTSHFSWTTCDSESSHQHSPTSSPSPLPPTVPLAKQRVASEAVPVAASILVRKHTVTQANRLTAATTATAAARRKSLSEADGSSGTARVQAMRTSPANEPSSSAASTLSTTTIASLKALPQPPTALSAVDHISLLESQQEDIRIRRSNLYRLLTDLNNAAPLNPMLTDFRRARQVEQQKRRFEDELSEIRREEHEIGMKLHRAWKKKETEDPHRGSALWVRRTFS